MPNSFLTSEGSVPDLRKYQTTDEKIEVLQNYLYQLLEELRYTLHNISADDIDAESWNKRLEEATESSKKISLISQTIDEIRMTISQTTDTIEGITSQYADLKLTVDGLIVAVEDGVEFDGSAFVQRSEFEVTASQVSSLVTQVSTNTNSISSLSSRITQTAEAIRTEVNSNYVSNTDMEDIESNWSSSLTQTANSISTSVAETYQTKSDAASVKSELQSAISQSASSITATVASTYETKTDAAGKLETAKSYALSQIGISEGNIRTYVGQTYQTLDSAATMQSSINQNADSITLTAQRISNLKIGSANLLRGSDKFELAESITSVETYNKGRWFLGHSGGSSGYTIHFEINDPPTSGVTNGVSVVNDVGQASLTQQITPASKIICDERTYTYSGYRRVNPNSTKDTVRSLVYASGRKTQGGSATVLYNFNEDIEKSDGWQKFRYSFVPDFYTGSGIVFYCGVYGEGIIDYCGLKLEEGDVDTSWEMNEYDIRNLATAQLKVDVETIQSTVTNLTGAVTEVTQTANDIQSTVAAMSVGGRNYIRNSETLEGWTGSADVSFDTTAGEVTFPAKTSNAWKGAWANNYLPYKLVRNKQVRVSCEWYAAKGVEIKLYYDVMLVNSGETTCRLYSQDVTKTLTGTGKWEKIVYDAVTLSDSYFSIGSGLTSYDTANFGVRFYSHNTCRNTFKIRRPKCEAGTMATDWTPAPEDFSTQIKQTAYEISQKVSAGEVVSVINQSADKISASAIDIDLSGMVTFNDLTNTSKTIINGNVIQTGTILADRLRVKQLSGISANLGTITAGTINGGTINADKVTINNLDASQIKTGTLNSSVVYSGKVQATQIESTTLAAINANLGSITAGTIDASLVTVKNLNASAITSGTISSHVVYAGTIAADKITSGTLNSNVIYSGTIAASKITSGTLASNVIYSGAIAASQITSGTISASRIGSETITSGKLRINGTIKFYEDSSATTAYGTIGYATGNDGNSNTDGIRMHVDGTHRLFISNAGAILEGGSRISLKATLTKCTGNLTCQQFTTNGKTWLSGGLETGASPGVIAVGKLNTTTHVGMYSSGECYTTGQLSRNSSGYVQSSSSNRYKKNLERDLTSEDVSAWYDLPLYHGSYKDEYCSEFSSYYHKHFPLMTVEDIEEICPEANFHAEDGSLRDCSWDSFVIIPIMLKMIQDQKKRIDELEGKVS